MSTMNDATEIIQIKQEQMETDQIGNNHQCDDAESDETVNGQIKDECMDVAEAKAEEDDSRAEATFQYTVQNISKLKETALSPPHIVRNLPWKIMAMPRTQGPERTRSLGFFLQCNTESDSPVSVFPEIQHLFYCKENDWGFSNYLPWGELLDPEKGYVTDNCVTLEVYVVADAPHGVCWDSKKHTGYVGLKNQGATCYLNSLLQTLYFTNKLRRVVYLMPTECDDGTKSVPLALQRVYYELQFSDKPVGTKKLTRSFGWETLDSFMQHDAQELCRVLLDNMENKMKGTCVEGTIPQLFEGKMLSYIKCKNVNYDSQREETFFDVQLNIKGKKDVHESFKDYVTEETLEGDNKYDAGEYGMQDSEKGVVFVSFPPVLHLHLMRFMYDPATDTNIKINDRFEFLEKLDLDEYLQKKGTTRAIYLLHAVLVHSGDNYGGHYVAYINPRCDGKWFKFDDDVVSRCVKREAVDNNYGGNDDDLAVRNCTNAYMLVYIRETEAEDILHPVLENEIPELLVNRLSEERMMECQKRKERNEAHLYMNIQVVLEDDFCAHQGIDLFHIDKLHSRLFRIKKSATLNEFMDILAENLKYPVGQIRLWPFQLRDNDTNRPTLIDPDDGQKTVHDLAKQTNPWLVFVETLPHESTLKELPPFDREGDVLLFLKLYDPRSKSISYCGHLCAKITLRIEQLLPELNRRARYPVDTPLMLFEEIGPNNIVTFSDLSKPLESICADLMDGDIIAFQRKDDGYKNFELPTVDEYFKHLANQIEVTFYDKQVANDQGVPLLLSLRMKYHQISDMLAQHFNYNSSHIQFFKAHDGTVHPVRCTVDTTLKDMLTCCKSRQPKKIYYQQLNINISDLENKKQFKCTWFDVVTKEERELVVYPEKTGRVVDILDEARKQLAVGGRCTDKLRLLEIACYKIMSVQREELMLDQLFTINNRTFRIEEVPADELTLSDDEFLIPVAHFNKEVYQTFGNPFMLKIKVGEPFDGIKERIQKRLDVADKEFEKYKFAVVILGRMEYITEHEKPFNYAQYVPHNIYSSHNIQMKPWIGVDHVNKMAKRPRCSYQEKAIKIHN